MTPEIISCIIFFMTSGRRCAFGVLLFLCVVCLWFLNVWQVMCVWSSTFFVRCLLVVLDLICGGLIFLFLNSQVGECCLYLSISLSPDWRLENVDNRRVSLRFLYALLVVVLIPEIMYHPLILLPDLIDRFIHCLLSSPSEKKEEEKPLNLD
jgi:hypothetical protein